MKRQPLLTILFFLLFCNVSAIAQQPFPFNETGYDNVMRQAKTEKRPVFYMIYADWCPHCHKMRDEIFPDADVSALLAQHYVVAAQDVEKPGGKAVAKRFNVNSYPTFVIVDADANVLYGFSGELKKDDFIKEVKLSMKPENQLPYLKKAFENTPSDGNAALALIMAQRKANIAVQDVATRYFATQKDEQLVSALNWKIIANGVSDMASREFQYALKHQNEFAQVASEKRVQRKIENIIVESLRPNAEKGDTLRYSQQRALAKQMKLRKADSLVYVFDKQIYEKTQNWKAYQAATITATDDFAWKDYAALRNTAGVYLAAINDKEALSKAVRWSERSVDLQQSKEGMIQIAKLYEKLGDIAKAKAAAQNAKDFCVRVGFGTKEADEILNRLQSR